jgi:hypothetical protein
MFQAQDLLLPRALAASVSTGNVPTSSGTPSIKLVAIDEKYASCNAGALKPVLKEPLAATPSCNSYLIATLPFVVDPKSL